MEIKIINNIYNDENTYIVYKNGSAFVIDPGNNDEEIINECKSLGVKIEAILLTHCHYDHMEFLEELREKTNAPLMCGDNCALNIANPKINLTSLGLGRIIKAKEPQKIINDGETVNIVGIDVKCIYTPGHTNCSVCYIAENNVFAGDTLFKRNCGRWDLPTGDGETLIKSIKEKLYTLDDEMTVYSGHGANTSIGYEKNYNLVVKA